MINHDALPSSKPTVDGLDGQEAIPADIVWNKKGSRSWIEENPLCNTSIWERIDRLNRAGSLTLFSARAGPFHSESGGLQSHAITFETGRSEEGFKLRSQPS
ncbi:hypothetical protein PSHT_11244 [Puccinia striiformis]|uniref:Uncharacterized protein n=2 Tax=Puccinia striiformis TaxID=27350 RepID=A0A0L0UXK0_9BASI|nr:hypothetical protein KEM48_002273 [Puccinia striiformis f. sp. tritici PST-130]KNE91777.1 hypothetical protein PSTG_14795 [Puccinia striiformis f. sp. tritici PST-78]POW04326.1 hypothetical protein PSHT_11244 [Puccinia striiformis]